ncbi:MAG: LemA family protein [Candidatus Altiarchaeum hamiconexum]|uniref:LemA family protein n=1 Tax=Candidatus Altarchaeum hamiconexum TaxID=1803513 RepID=A0A8J7YWX8_9ARCH|nr:LemA family protein [Candidatus Altarchaeum hamiconexum]NCN68343.1 LemA family protein [Candidatus Altarchaeum hamiconexum]NCS91360.1 LemA family protein [Candidatus Altarchaeum hamiconexum]NCT00993.1 LemA family protein [Candidatus Altarchaeum hamiconexum]
MQHERETLKGIIKAKSKKSSAELVRELRDENDPKRLEN